jgi:hypothetical protein
MKQCDNILALSAELGVHCRLMYKWRDQFDPVDKGQELPAPLNLRESRLRKEVNQLKRVLADKTLELDCFKGLLQETCGWQPGRDAAGLRKRDWIELSALTDNCSKLYPARGILSS